MVDRSFAVWVCALMAMLMFGLGVLSGYSMASRELAAKMRAADAARVLSTETVMTYMDAIMKIQKNSPQDVKTP